MFCVPHTTMHQFTVSLYYHMAGESYHRQLGLCCFLLRDIFWALIDSLVCWFYFTSLYVLPLTISHLSMFWLERKKLYFSSVRIVLVYFFFLTRSYPCLVSWGIFVCSIALNGHYGPRTSTPFFVYSLLFEENLLQSTEHAFSWRTRVILLQQRQFVASVPTVCDCFSWKKKKKNKKKKQNKNDCLRPKTRDTHKKLKRTLFFKTKPNMRIFWVISVIKLQNDA